MDRRESSREIEGGGAHVLVISCLIQGHVNPMVQFSKRLAAKGLTVTLVIPSLTKKLSFNHSFSYSNFRVEHISDGVEEGENNLSLDAKLERLQATVSTTLPHLIHRLRFHHDDSPPPKVLVYDSVIPWVLDIALEHGLHGAPFFTQSCAVTSVFYYVVRRGLEIPLRGKLLDFAPPLLQMLENCDLPSMVTRDDMELLYPVLFRMVMGQLSNLHKAKWLLVNSFLELEEEVVKWLRIQLLCPMLTVGPTIPSMYLDNRVEDDNDYGLSLFVKPDGEAHIKWLDSKKPGSVIYVSFGSLAILGEEQMEEIGWALKKSNHQFLWVVRESEKIKLPINFEDETSEKGLVVSWCSQLQVLSHQSVGCFVTHCGWNSTLEALSLGVPIVAMPRSSDQPTNAKFIVDVWKVGVRVMVDEKGTGRREEIEACVKEMFEGDKGKEMKKNSLRLRELAKQAVGEGGSSDKDIDEFIAGVLSA